MGLELLGPTGLLVIGGLIALLLLVLIVSIPAVIIIVGIRSSANEIQRTTLANIVPLIVEATRHQEPRAPQENNKKPEVLFEGEGWDA